MHVTFLSGIYYIFIVFVSIICNYELCIIVLQCKILKTWASFDIEMTFNWISCSNVIMFQQPLPLLQRT
uniref:Secreted protein n=1 Tax=Ascaris lumbricoides TaxID=6252 RepID=A0A0M3IVS0_ASCLU